MSEAFLGELRAFPFSIIPSGWAACDGALMAPSGNQALFSLIGTTYGGNGTTSFALPDLRGATSIGSGASYALGQRGGEATHALTTAEIPTHSHTLFATTDLADTRAPSPTVALAQPTVGGAGGEIMLYDTAAPTVALAADAVGTAGQSQPHTNMQPVLALTVCICIAGIYPTRA